MLLLPLPWLRALPQVLETESGQTLGARAAVEEAHKEVDRVKRNLQEDMRKLEVGGWVRAPLSATLDRLGPGPGAALSCACASRIHTHARGGLLLHAPLLAALRAW